MENYKISKSLNGLTVWKFVKKRWIEDGSSGLLTKIWVKTPMLRSDLNDFSDVYIVVKKILSVTGNNNAIRKKS